MHAASATALLAGVVDYAGLFPPAGRAMADAVAEYRDARDGPSAWMLGRFVVPATGLDELGQALDAVTAPTSVPWAVSAIVRCGSDSDVAAVADFNTRACAGQAARVDAIEGKPDTPEQVDWLAIHTSRFGHVYVEITPGPYVTSWLARVVVHELRAKVRTGGVTAEAFPGPSALAAFLADVVRSGVMFKATAGLHHAVRGPYRLTYAPDSASAPMYGYLNVLLATTALRDGATTADAERLLQQSDVSSLTFEPDAVRWGRREFPVARLRATRERHLVSFGSCSFREPVEELAALAGR